MKKKKMLKSTDEVGREALVLHGPLAGHQVRQPRVENAAVAHLGPDPAEEVPAHLRSSVSISKTKTTQKKKQNKERVSYWRSTTSSSSTEIVNGERREKVHFFINSLG